MSELDKVTFSPDGVPIVHEGSTEQLQGVVSGNVQLKKKGRVGRYLSGLKPVLAGIVGVTAKRFLWDAVRAALKVDEPSGGYDYRRSEVVARPSYRNYYENDPYQAYQRAAHYEYNDVIFETRGDAERVLDQMRGILSRQKVVRVAQLYDLCRVKGEYTDNYYGWASLFDAKVIPTRDGRYKIALPPPMSIN